MSGKRACSHCWGTDHDKRRCPRLGVSPEELEKEREAKRDWFKKHCGTLEGWLRERLREQDRDEVLELVLCAAGNATCSQRWEVMRQFDEENKAEIRKLREKLSKSPILVGNGTVN